MSKRAPAVPAANRPAPAKPQGVVVPGAPGSEFVARAWAEYAGEAVGKLYLVVKRSYDLRDGAPAVPSRARFPIFENDVFFTGNSPMESSVRHERDLCPPKVATDVVVNGRAYAPEGRPVTELVVSVEVQGHGKKEVLVTGDRGALFPDPDQSLTTREVRFTAPRPFREMPLVWERAYGGSDRLAFADPLPYMKNPIGTGFLMGATDRPYGYLLVLPNLEDPAQKLVPKKLEVDPANWATGPLPCSLGWYPRYWLPRAELMGNPDPGIPMEELFPDGLPEGVKIEWKPTDIRYYNGAPAGLSVGPLAGNETIVLTNVHRSKPRYVVTLPGDKPAATWDPGDGVPRLAKLTLGTVALQMEEERAYLTWHAACDITGVFVPRFMGDIKIQVG
jgi:hypothetical protein